MKALYSTTFTVSSRRRRALGISSAAIIERLCGWKYIKANCCCCWLLAYLAVPPPFHSSDAWKMSESPFLRCFFFCSRSTALLLLQRLLLLFYFVSFSRWIRNMAFYLALRVISVMFSKVSGIYKHSRERREERRAQCHLYYRVYIQFCRKSIYRVRCISLASSSGYYYNLYI